MYMCMMFVLRFLISCRSCERFQEVYRKGRKLGEGSFGARISVGQSCEILVQSLSFWCTSDFLSLRNGASTTHLL